VGIAPGTRNVRRSSRWRCHRAHFSERGDRTHRGWEGRILQVDCGPFRSSSVRRIVLVSLAVIGLLASGCNDPNTTSYDPVGAAAADANLDLMPHDQITSCVESTKLGAYVGDAVAFERWTSAGQSEANLAEVCNQIWRADPAALATIHSDWLATRASIAATP
jgi:hypothetical protein